MPTKTKLLLSSLAALVVVLLVALIVSTREDAKPRPNYAAIVATVTDHDAKCDVLWYDQGDAHHDAVICSMPTAGVIAWCHASVSEGECKAVAKMAPKPAPTSPGPATPAPAPTTGPPAP